MDLIFQDDYLVAINKPAGLLVHRSAIDKHETRFALQMVRDILGQRVYPVHRLDKPTSGVLLFARDQPAARAMTVMFTHGEVQKTYQAIVRGFTEAQGLIDYPLQEQPDRMTDANARPGKMPQSAITEYRRLMTAEFRMPVGPYATARYSVLEVKPRTGRKHQIRRHMKHIFHPVVGDTTHGDGRHNRFFRQHLACDRMLLHANSLAFCHPVSGMPVQIRADPDPEFARILQELEKIGPISPD